MSDSEFSSVDREIRLEPGRDLVFRLSKDLQLNFVNDYFTEFTGYEIQDILGSSAKDFEYFEVPVVISRIIDEHIAEGKNINLILKNGVKDGRYYWYSTNFKYNLDQEGNLLSLSYYRMSPPRVAIPALEKLYKKLTDIEKHSTIDIASKYLEGFLEDKNMTFAEYTAFLSNGNHYDYDRSGIEEFIGSSSVQSQEKKKGILGSLFKK